MNPLVVPAAAVIVMVPPAAIFTGWHLIRDRRFLWKPGHPLPAVPPDSALAGLRTRLGAPAARERQPEMAGRAA